MTLNHPIVNLCSGKRLYYFLLKTSGSAQGGEEELRTIFEKVDGSVLRDLKKRSGFYLVFGEADFVLRIWASEQEAFYLFDSFQKSRLISIDACFLCSRTSTWFQRKIEASPDWAKSLQGPTLGAVEETVRSIVFGEVPKGLSLEVADLGEYGIGTGGQIKFFLLAKEDPLGNFLAYNMIENKLLLEADEFKLLERISLYSAYDVRGEGRWFLMKAEAENFSDGTRAIRAIGDWLQEAGELKTTTHVVCETRWQSELGSFVQSERTYMKRTLLQYYVNNLSLVDSICRVASVGGSESEAFQKGPEDASSPRESFYHLFSEARTYASLFWHSSEWGRDLVRLRQLCDYVVRQRNDELRGVIITDYIFFEKYLRDALIDLINQVSDELSKDISARQRKAIGSDFDDWSSGFDFFTLKHLVILSGIIESRLCKGKLSKADEEISKRFREISIFWVKDRNLLAHGDVMKVFVSVEKLVGSTASKDVLERFKEREFDEVWEYFVRAYFDVRMYVPRYVLLLQRLQSRFAKIQV